MASHDIIKDDGALFQIIPTTRKIAVPASHKVIGTVGDHNSEEITFQCPNIIDGHNVANCAEHYIIYVNADGKNGRVDIPAENITIDETDMYLTWVIDSRVTAKAGFISFSVYFVDKDENDKVVYKWGTTTCKECQVLETVVNNGEPVYEEITLDDVSVDDVYVTPDTDGSSLSVELSVGDESVTKIIDVPAGTDNFRPEVILENNNLLGIDGGLKEGIIPEGTKDITENGEHDVTNVVSVNVDVPIPEGYIKPEDEMEITENGTHDVTECASVDVNVPQIGITPTGTKTITENGTYDVTNVATAEVNVPIPEGYIKPTGTKEITEGGEHDVSEFEKVNVNVAGGDDKIDDLMNNTLVEANLPNTTKIKEYVFKDNSNLVTVSMPNVTEIGSNAFCNCSNLALTELPIGLKTIGGMAFYSCSNLALTKLPSGLTSIASNTFFKCYKLALTELPSGITSIGDSAFYQCQKLAITEIPSGVTKISSSAFQSCSNLTSITFKGTPTSIASGAFNGCTKLTTINVPWAEGAVANSPWGATSAQINYNYTGG